MKKTFVFLSLVFLMLFVPFYIFAQTQERQEPDVSESPDFVRFAELVTEAGEKLDWPDPDFGPFGWGKDLSPEGDALMLGFYGLKNGDFVEKVLASVNMKEINSENYKEFADTFINRLNNFFIEMQIAREAGEVLTSAELFEMNQPEEEFYQDLFSNVISPEVIMELIKRNPRSLSVSLAPVLWNGEKVILVYAGIKGEQTGSINWHVVLRVPFSEWTELIDKTPLEKRPEILAHVTSQILTEVKIFLSLKKSIDSLTLP